MSLAYLILGLLQQQARTGYDLKTECFDACMSHLWQADQAQIYRTLDKLKAQGWLTCSVEIQHDRPNRNVFHVTEAGKEAFTQWLQTHQPLPIVRDPLLAQLYFAAQLPNEAIVALLEQELHARRKKLAECREMTVPVPKGATSREHQMHELVLELVTQREQTYLHWLQTAIDRIHSQPE